VRIVRAASQPAIPWKNGGGTTREIARAPLDSSLDSFDWRVSRAHVASGGPFSRFADVDRTLLVLTGAGVRLDVEGQESVTLTVRSAPFSFAGDVAVSATLADGPIDDLNVMSRRGRTRHEAVRRRVAGRTEIATGGDAMVVVVEGGEITVDEMTLSVGDALLLDAAEVIEARSHEGADLVVVDVWNRR